MSSTEAGIKTLQKAHMAALTGCPRPYKAKSPLKAKTGANKNNHEDDLIKANNTTGIISKPSVMRACCVS